MRHHKEVRRKTIGAYKTLSLGSLLLLLVVSSSILVRAQKIVAPPGAPPDNGTSLNTLGSLDDFVSLIKTSPTETVNGPLIFASTTPSSAIIGDFPYATFNNVSLTGFAGYSNASIPAWRPPALPTGAGGGAAVYGSAFSSSATKSYGIYGYANGASAAAVLGKISAYQSGVLTSMQDASAAGDYSNITTGDDGLPIVTFAKGSNRLVMHCTKTDCSAVTATTPDCSNPLYNCSTQVDTVVSPRDVGEYSSIAIGSDGLPIISYYEDIGDSSGVCTRSRGNLKILHCGKVDCSDTNPLSVTGNKITTVDETTLCSVGRYNSIAIGVDGLPVVSYWRDSNRQLPSSGIDAVRLLHCGKLDCSDTGSSLLTGNTITDLDLGSGSGNYLGLYTAVSIGADGLPIVAYNRGNQLYVVHCTSTNCTSFGAPQNPNGAAGHEDIRMTIAADSNHFPIIAYVNSSNTLFVSHCTNVSCTSFDATKTVSTTADETSIAIGADGKPLIAYAYTTGNNCGSSGTSECEELRLARCSDQTCSNSSFISIRTLDGDKPSPFDVGHNNSMAIGPDGYGIISYHHRQYDRLMFMHFCGSFDCVSSSNPTGLAGKFFGKLFVDDSAGTPANPSINVKTKISSPSLRATSTLQGIKSTAGTHIAGRLSRALSGKSNDYGIYGQSLGSGIGILLNSVIQTAVPGGSDYFGIFGSVSSSVNAGIGALYGYTDRGNGVAGVVGDVSGIPIAVQGVASNTSGATSASIKGWGGAFAAYFEGDVVLPEAANKICIGTSSTCFNEANLKNLLNWCNSSACSTLTPCCPEVCNTSGGVPPAC